MNKSKTDNPCNKKTLTNTFFHHYLSNYEKKVDYHFNSLEI